MSIIYQSEPERGRYWQTLCRAMAPERNFYLWDEFDGDPGEVHYLITWQPPAGFVSQFPNLEVLFSIGAGVDQLNLAEIPNQVSVVRMINHDLTSGMVEYVICAVLALHRDIPLYLGQQRQHLWQPHPRQITARTCVGVMGLGELGQTTLTHLHRLGFKCQGWSRSARSVDNVQTYAGVNNLAEFLNTTDILVCLLPLTQQTQGILDSSLLNQLPIGARLVHAGRAAQLVTQDLMAALNCGQLKAAILDVVDPEPLPGNHPLWSNEKVWITPHIASSTQSDSAFGTIYDNILKHESQRPMTGVVDRRRGY